MILRNGVDIVDLTDLQRRMDRSQNDLLAAFLTKAEQDYVNGRVDRAGTRWAAKEATMKSLGLGLDVIGPHDVEVVDNGGAPGLILHGGAIRRARELNLTIWTLSLSHTPQFAIASVVAFGESHA
ncbi:holo-ACP synthase [Brevibacterium aurantiacum]|uniref:Holo-ACP synthase n=1 Tax=Brevibacterium aurantiacum TaxID=273384 RepID=A0A4Z0KGI5_BREAU|nr:holo-ACP synthase [Brevibacterium aurantiacum]TGD36361.1 holo-ACP synthase [Brevibacterium aurantiacum]